MSQTFYMRTLRSFLDQLCLENFGWFYSSLGRAWSSQFMTHWDLKTLAAFLIGRKFNNCSEEQVFQAVITYCRTKADFDQLVPGLSQSCGNYLRYIQSVPRLEHFELFSQFELFLPKVNQIYQISVNGLTFYTPSFVPQSQRLF